MAAPSRPPRPWPTLLGLYLLAVAINLAGIAWGLPGSGRGLLPPDPPSAVTREAEKSWGTVQSPARDLTLGPPMPDAAETPARTLRRFYLYTADPDEVVAMMGVARLNPLAGRWDPGITHYGGFFLYSVGASLKLASAGGAVALRSDPAFYLSHPEAMGRMYLVGRLLVVLVGGLAIPLVWVLARPLYGRRVALLAAAGAAAAPAWIVWSHTMKPWAFGAPFALAALTLGRRLIATPRPGRDAAWAGALAGLAMGAGSPNGPVLLGPLVGLALRRGESRSRRLGWAALAVAAALVALLIVQPYWLFDPRRTVAAWGRLLGFSASDYRPAVLAAFAWGTLGTALGHPLMLAGLLEGAYLAWRVREALPILVPTFAMLFAIAVKTGEFPGEGMFVRWVVPAALILSMLGVGGLCRLARVLPRPVRLVPATGVIPTLLISAALLQGFVAAAGPESTRHLAGAWLNALPKGASIGVPGALAPFRSPFFRIDRHPLVILDQPDRFGGGDLPDYFLVAERSDLPGSPAFRARYQEVRRFEPRALPLASIAFKAYPFADPPITIYAARATER